MSKKPKLDLRLSEPIRRPVVGRGAKTGRIKEIREFLTQNEGQWCLITTSAAHSGYSGGLSQALCYLGDMKYRTTQHHNGDGTYTVWGVYNERVSE